MELPNQGLPELFEQLGLPSSHEEIEQFFATHSLPQGIKLVDAPFWSEQQSAFLKEQFLDDAEWAPVVDELNARLHEQ
ncbi:MAG: DUF2789 domain-containing protein [Pseudomonas sp.]